MHLSSRPNRSTSKSVVRAKNVSNDGKISDAKIIVLTIIPAEETENIRISPFLLDTVAFIAGNYAAQTELNFTLEYSDGYTFKAGSIKCSEKCVDGKYDGIIDLKNSRTDTVKVSE